MRTSYELSDWQGYLTHSEIDALQGIANDIMISFSPDIVIVKIGAGAGTDTIAIREVLSELVIFSIDILAGESPITTNEHLRLAECGYDRDGSVIRIWGDSKVVGKKWPIPIDWLHIDGDHGEDGIRGDISAWLRHVKIGGIVSFHDYGDANWPDVKVVVDEYMQWHERLEMYCVDKLAVYRKIE